MKKDKEDYMKKGGNLGSIKICDRELTLCGLTAINNQKAYLEELSHRLQSKNLFCYKCRI